MNFNIKRVSVLTLLIGGFGDKFLLFLQGIVMLPIYLSVLGVETYGYWLATGGVLAWLSAFDMRLAVVINQKISKLSGAGRTAEIAEVFGNGMLVYTVILLPVIPIAVFTYPLLVEFISLPEELSKGFRTAYHLAAVALVVSFLNTGLVALSKGILQPLFPVVTHFIFGIFQIILLVGFLHAGLGVVSIGLSLLIRFLIVAILNTYNCWRIFIKMGFTYKKLTPNRFLIKDYFSVLPPMFLSRLSGGIVEKVEPTLILKFLGPEVTIIYVATKAASSVLQGLANAVTGSIFSSFTYIYGEGIIKSTSMAFRRSLEVLSGVTIIFSGGYILMNPSFVPLWVGQEHYAGHILTILIGVSLTISVILNFINSTLTAIGDIRFASWGRFFEECLRLGLIVFSIKYLGLLGIPVSILITSSAALIIFSKRLKNTLFKDTKFLFTISKVITIAFTQLLLISLGAYYLTSSSWSVFILQTLIITLLLYSLQCLLYPRFKEETINLVKYGLSMILLVPGLQKNS